MKRSELHDKMYPFYQAWKEKMIKDGETCWDHAYLIAYVKEVMWTLAADEDNTDDAELDSIDMKWFFDNVKSMPQDAEETDEVFSNAYEHVQRLCNTIKDYWKRTH